MRTSIAAVSLSGELPEKLEAIAKAGFDGAEIFENDFLTFDGCPRDVDSYRPKHRIWALLIGSSVFDVLPEAQRRRMREA
ncbi:hypothetical protein M1D34_29105 (plasmid) [Ensifer sp. D2-11]